MLGLKNCFITTLIEEDKRNRFISEHGTAKKLEYCEFLGLSVPESYYLLGIIYNNELHLKNNVDVARPVAIKLENMTIKKMIRDIFTQVK